MDDGDGYGDGSGGFGFGFGGGRGEGWGDGSGDGDGDGEGEGYGSGSGSGSGWGDGPGQLIKHTPNHQKGRTAMELGMEDLKELLGTTDTDIGNDLIGSRVVVRTRTSGVSIGVLDAVSYGPVVVRLVDAVRIWSWSNAFTLSELASDGADCRIAHHPDGIVISDTGCELIPVSDAAWSHIQANWEVGAK